MIDNDLLGQIRTAFDHDDVPRKNLMLRKAYDEIERLRAAAGGEQGGEADPPCTDCGGTGITHQTERTCSCVGGEKRRKPEPPVSSTVRNGRMGF